MPRFDECSENASAINLKIFPQMIEYTSLRKNSKSILERDKALRSL